jgi:hypothetical protein
MLLAVLFIVFGIFSYQIPLRGLIYPSLPLRVEPFGIWQPPLTTLLILAALAIGVVIYVLGGFKESRNRGIKGQDTRILESSNPGILSVRTFVGGERIADSEESRVTGTAFYSSVKHLPILDELLKYGEAGAFDLYNWLVAAAEAIAVVTKDLVHRVLDGLVTAAGRVVRWAGVGLSYMQTGSLPLYVAWVLLGAAACYLLLLLR